MAVLVMIALVKDGQEEHLALLAHECLSDDQHIDRFAFGVDMIGATDKLSDSLQPVHHERFTIPATKPNVPTFEEWQATRRYSPDLRKEDQDVFGDWCDDYGLLADHPLKSKPIPALIYDQTRVILIVTPDWPDKVRAVALYDVLITNYEVTSMDLEECERELYAFDHPTE